MLCFLPKKDPRRLHSCNKEAVCAVHLAINHPLPYDKSSVALDCYANLELVSAFAGQKLLIGVENNQATYEAEWRKGTCVVGHQLQELGTGRVNRRQGPQLVSVMSLWTMGLRRERTHSIQTQD